MTFEELVELLEQEAIKADETHDVAGALRRTDRLQEPLVSAAFQALEYMYASPDEEARATWSHPFAPMLEFGEVKIPPPLHTIPDDVLGIWELLANAVSSPLLKARFADLLWERRWTGAAGNSADWAREAVAAYRALAERLRGPPPTPEDGWRLYPRAELLERALELARSINDQQLTAAVAQDLLETAQWLLRQDPAVVGAGVVMTLLGALANLPAQLRPRALIELLELTEQRYSEPFASDNIADVLAALLSGQDRQEVRERQVRRWLAAAETSRGIIRVANLQRAQELADLHGLKGLSDEALRALQQPPEEGDFKTIESEFTVPKELIEAYIEQFLAGPDAISCLRAFAQRPPPSGIVDENIAKAQELMERFPIALRLATRVHHGDFGPIRTVQTEEEHLDDNILRTEAFNIEVWAQFAPDILDRIIERYGRPSRQQLAEFLETDLIAPEVAERFAAATEHFWDGLYDECAHIVLPRIERVIREGCRRTGMVIINPPRGFKAGEVRSLGSLLHALQPGFDNQSHIRYLINLLVEPVPGINLRNRLLHALIDSASRQQAALALHAAYSLTTLGIVASGTSDEVAEREGSDN